MRFVGTAIAGAFMIEPEIKADERGTFTRTFCVEAFAAHGLATQYVQCNLSTNHKRATLRGMHYQLGRHAEAKLVRATRGRVFDVALDLRSDSETYRCWVGVELDAAKCNAFYIPEGCAHGFLTLEDDCEIFYQMSKAYAPEFARGVRWDDPNFGIAWPHHPEVISRRDASYEDFVQGNIN